MKLSYRILALAIALPALIWVDAVGSAAQAQERGDSRQTINLIIRTSADRRVVVPTLDQGFISFEIFNGYPHPILVQLSVDGASPLVGGGGPAGGGGQARGKSTQVVVGAGQTEILGGVTNGKSVTIEATPKLTKIPILGTLFRNRGEQRSDNNLLVIITPEIVNPSN